MANRSFTKLQAAGRGQVHIAASWGSGAAEDNSFPTTAGIITDGYISDAYGGGVYGISHVPDEVGQYEVLLTDVYVKCISVVCGVESLDDTKDVTVSVKAPAADVVTGTDGTKRTRFRVQVKVAGVNADLTASDRVHLQADLDNSSADV